MDFTDSIQGYHFRLYLGGADSNIATNGRRSASSVYTSFCNMCCVENVLMRTCAPTVQAILCWQCMKTEAEGRSPQVAITITDEWHNIHYQPCH